MSPHRPSPHRRPSARIRAIVAALAVLAAAAALGSTAAAPTANAQAPGWWDQPSVCSERVSLTDDDRGPNANSGSPAMSDDGRYVAFVSAADDIAAGDDNANTDVFVRDRVRGTTARVAAAPDAAADGSFGTLDAALSGDGTTVAYAARAARGAPDQPWRCGAPGATPRPCVLARRTDALDTIVLDRALGAVRGDGVSRWPVLSRDGALGAFWSSSADLVAGDANGQVDVFVADPAGGAVEVVSRGAAAANGPSGAIGEPGREAVSVSRDGRYVAFASRATNLVAGTVDGEPHVYLFDRTLGATARLDAGATGDGPIAASYLGGRQAMSDDGRFVVFGARVGRNAASAPERVVLHDRTAQRWTVLRGGASTAGAADGPAAVISGDGRYVAFAAGVAAPTRVGLFVHDRNTGRTFGVAVGFDGGALNAPAGRTADDGLAITADGRQIAWRTTATNVVTDDLGGRADVFVSWPCDRSDEVEPRATPSPTARPTASPSPTPSPAPSPSRTPVPAERTGCVCAEARRRLPADVLDAAVDQPERVYGWRLGLDVGRPVGVANPPRACLSVRHPNVPYHPLWNGPMYVVGCRQALRP